MDELNEKISYYENKISKLESDLEYADINAAEHWNDY